MLLAIEERSDNFDFGLGDEPFKKRFTTNAISVTNWGLYPLLKVKNTGYENTCYKPASR
jgi:CelD/BcsL family acetyltransferase involved in cellulose biosynthesis